MSAGMTEIPKDEDKLPDAEAEERFRRTVGNLVNTPHKPHVAPKGRSDELHTARANSDRSRTPRRGGDGKGPA
jgi:hypothetical protein